MFTHKSEPGQPQTNYATEKITQDIILYLAFPPITALVRITVTLYRAVPRHLILQRIVLLILPKSEPGQLQKN